MKLKHFTEFQRGVSLLLIPLYLVAATPGLAATVSSIEPAPTKQAVPAVEQPVSIASEPTTSLPIANHTVPDVSPPILTPQFSDRPSTQEISMARVFDELLVPYGTPTDSENADLAQAILSFKNQKDQEDVSTFEEFLRGNPQSAWQVSLLVNIGSHYRKYGYFTRALDAWDQAWKLAKDEQQDFRIRMLADRAMGEMMQLNAWVGRKSELRRLFAELGDREVSGAATEKISMARQGLAGMKDIPEGSFKCGPYALQAIKRFLAPGEPDSELIRNARSTPAGFSLNEVAELAHQVGLEYRMVQRTNDSPIPTPSVIHWKLNHYGAVLEHKDGKYLIEDLTFNTLYGRKLWVSDKAIAEEASGYFLVPEKQEHENGYRLLAANEGDVIHGRGLTYTSDPNCYRCNHPQSCDICGKTGGMARYSIHLMLVSLHIADTPIEYEPPVGPAIDFTVTYNQRDVETIAGTGISYMGKKWNHGWLAYIRDNNGGSAMSTVYRYTRGGGAVIHKLKTGSSTDYELDETGAGLVFVPASKTYILTYPDGSQEYYEQSDNSSGWRRVFLKRIKDTAGNTVTLTYDSNLRLASITDAASQVTTLSYNGIDPNEISKVTDPFGRYATFEYDNQLRLKKVTDPEGITSEFTYDGNTDFIKALTTPYGTTTFSKYENDMHRYIIATDPTGASERVEFLHNASGVGSSDPNFSAGFVTLPNTTNTVNNQYLNYRNTFYWDKKAYESGVVYTNATIYHWVHGDPQDVTSGIIESIKKPLESRIWFKYPNQPNSTFVGSITLRRPSWVGRILSSTNSQEYFFGYNSKGNLTNVVDPMGRDFELNYAANGIDLTEIKRVRSSHNGLLLTLGSYTSTHKPQTITDASGESTSITYNSKGQPTYVTDPLSHTTTLLYTNNFLSAVDGPWTGTVDKSYLSYDTMGRLKSVIRPDGWATTNYYDNLNRLTNVTYPDGTFEDYTYKWLNVVKAHDRKGRRTFRAKYDAMGRPTEVVDLLNHTNLFGYCDCGALETLTDAKGQITTWVYDLERRLTNKVYHGSSPIVYTYEDNTSRLKSVTDLKGQTKNYTYNNDDTLAGVTYDNEEFTTPDVEYHYDSDYPRLTSVVDGTGTNTFTYNAYLTSIPGTPQPGTGRLQKIDGPFTSDDITFTYDALGRIYDRSINGSGNNYTQFNYDTLGRVWRLTTTLGNFDTTFSGNDTDRPYSLSYPNGQSNIYLYDGVTQDYHLQSIWNRKNGGSTLSKFEYEHDVTGLITKWTQQADAATPTVYEFDYDPVDQLIGARAYTSGSSATSTKAWYYDYDAAGNRTREQAGTSGNTSTITKADYSNNLNQLESYSGSDPLPVTFWGKVNEAAIVTVNSVSNKVDANNQFRGTVNLNAGSQSVAVVAKDYGGTSGNTTTKNYTVIPQGGISRTMLYDANGNLTNQVVGTTTTTYRWDAEDRLVSVITGSQMSKFYYDGFSRRTKIEEGTYSGGTFTPNTSLTKNFVWVGGTIAEERNNSNTVQKKFFPYGEWRNGAGYGGNGLLFYARDHLGSLREMTDSASVVRARYDYDPYGRRSANLITGGSALEADWGFTGHYYHAPSGLHLAWFRAYDANLGRWISRDPIEEEDDLNLYSYVSNNPIDFFDPDGFAAAAAGGLLTTILVGGGEVTGAVVTGAGAVVAGVGGAVGYGLGTISVGDGEDVHDWIAEQMAKGYVGLASLLSCSKGDINRGPRGARKHTPGRGHNRKSQGPKKKKFQKKQQQKKAQKQQQYQNAVNRWNKMSDAAKKLQPELDPKNFLP